MNVLMIDTAHRIYWDDLPNTLKALQQAVGGYIEVVPLTEQLCVICNEESKLLGLPSVAAMPARSDVLCGPLVICRTTPDGEFTDAEEDDLYTVGEYLETYEGGKNMNCCKCGKKLLAGMPLCLTCEKDLERVPDESIRLGYYARHPEALAKLLIESNEEVDLGLRVCQRDCSADPDADIDCADEKFASCVVRWLLEPITEEDKHGYQK